MASKFQKAQKEKDRKAKGITVGTPEPKSQEQIDKEKAQVAADIAAKPQPTGLEGVGEVPQAPEELTSGIREVDGARFLLPREELEALEKVKGAQDPSLAKFAVRRKEVEAQTQEFLQLQEKRRAGEVLSQPELERLKELSNIPELREQILNPTATFKDFSTIAERFLGRKLTPKEKEELKTPWVPYDLKEESDVIQGLIKQVTQNAIQKTVGLGIGIDDDLRNVEASLINHKEGSADVLRAVQSNAYDPFDAIEDLSQMKQDIDDAEATLQFLSIYAPGVYGDMKGWEFQTRIKKIRRAVITREAEVINLAATGITGTSLVGGTEAGTPPPASTFFG